MKNSDGGVVWSVNGPDASAVYRLPESEYGERTPLGVVLNALMGYDRQEGLFWNAATLQKGAPVFCQYPIRSTVPDIGAV
jgi:hypothetical protein